MHRSIPDPAHQAPPKVCAGDPIANFWIGPIDGAKGPAAPFIVGASGAGGATCPADDFAEFKALVERVAQSDVDFTRALLDIACHLASAGDYPSVSWEMRVADLRLSPRCKLSIAVILSVMIAQALRNTRLNCAPRIWVIMLDHMGELSLIVRDNGLNCHNDYAPSMLVIERLLRALDAQVTVRSGREGTNEVEIAFLLTGRFRA